ncbi:MAG: glycosyltransferase [Chloroflexota bacterium]
MTVGQGDEMIEHLWPFGRLEGALLRRLVEDRLSMAPGRWVLWLSDPKSAGAFVGLRHIPSARLVRVFDAYDAWDLSPLVRGWWRKRAVLNGYSAAARYADIVFANTEIMAQRMEALGASRVSLLQNASPPVGLTAGRAPMADQASAATTDPYLVYVGRIHERVDTGLIAAVADAFPQVAVRLIGPVEREPDGWLALTARPNVRLERPVVGPFLRAILTGAAALLLPHRVDDYTRSQDAMKAWDALAAGTPVVATPVPPADRWPKGMAVVAADTDGFVAGVGSVLRGDLDAARPARLDFARANGWEVRAAATIGAIEEALGG